MNKETEINNFLTLFLHFAEYKAFALTGVLLIAFCLIKGVLLACCPIQGVLLAFYPFWIRTVA